MPAHGRACAVSCVSTHALTSSFTLVMRSTLMTTKLAAVMSRATALSAFALSLSSGTAFTWQRMHVALSSRSRSACLHAEPV